MKTSSKLSLSLLLALAACGGKQERPTAPAGASEATQATKSSSDAPAPQALDLDSPTSGDADADADAFQGAPDLIRLFDEADGILVRMKNGDSSQEMLEALQRLAKEAEALPEGEQRTRFGRLVSVMQLTVRPMKDETRTEEELAAFVRDVSGTELDPQGGLAAIGPSLEKELEELRAAAR